MTTNDEPNDDIEESGSRKYSDSRKSHDEKEQCVPAIMHDMIRSEENMMYKYLYSTGNKLFLLEVGKGVRSVFIRDCSENGHSGR